MFEIFKIVCFVISLSCIISMIIFVFYDKKFNKKTQMLLQKVKDSCTISNESLTLFFNLQQQTQKLLNHNFELMSLEDKEKYTKDMILYLLEEVHELLREINFKSYRKAKKPIVIENIKGELVDILHFYVNLCLVWDISPQDITSKFIEKNTKNLNRIKNENN